MNMPNELTVTPGQKITKYIAVPAINSLNSKLQVQFIRNSIVQNFDFDIIKNETQKLYTLEKYELKYNGEGDDVSYWVYYVIEYKDNVSYALKDNKLFVSDEKKLLPVNVYGIGINPTNSEIVFGSATNIKFSEVKDNKQKITFKKQKKNKKTDSY